MCKKMKDCDIIAEIKQAFKELDSDGDGYINETELKVRQCSRSQHGFTGSTCSIHILCGVALTLAPDQIYRQRWSV